MLKSLQALNRRNHRKACVVDGQTAWLGGMNVSDLHLHSVTGADCWRDNGVRVRGPEVALLDQELQATFNGRRTRPREFEQLQALRLNSTLRSRRWFKRDLTRRMDEEQQRVWMMTPYFVPGGRLLRAIRRAARRGLDVRLVIPRRSDVPFIRWISWRFCEQLMRDGVRVYEYLPRVLHAKSILFGRAAITGSTNLNHRSDLHDLEVDVVLEDPATLDRIKTQFMTDFAEAEALTIDKLQRRPWLKRLAGRLLVIFRSLF
ncbi:MAG: hypothetical protein H6978_06225 [Gammaproteobacteria bacterium]|nr:hypothetical protein [Gammaproteobacteria bacterium]